MFIKVRGVGEYVSYYNTNNDTMTLCACRYGYDFYYFKLFPMWFSYKELKENGKFDSPEKAEKIVEIIVNSIVEGVKILDLNEVIDKVKNEK